MKKLLSVLVLIALAIGGYLVYAAWSVERLKTAFATRDADTLEAIIDWPRVRESVRSEVQAVIAGGAATEKSGAAALGTMIGSALVGPIVDGWVNPAGLRKALANAKDNYRPPQIAGMRLITATLMRGRLLNDKGEPYIDFEMELGGGVWRVSRVTLAPELVEQARGPAMDGYLGALLNK